MAVQVPSGADNTVFFITTASPTRSKEFPVNKSPTTFSATITGTGAVTATVLVEGRLSDASGASLWTTLATLSLTGTTQDTKTSVYTGVWDSVRFSVTAISGTSAKVYMAYAH
mgnify:CR=1 FL=1